MGSNPSAATYFCHHHPTSEQASRFESLVKQIAELSPQEREALVSLTQTDRSSLLTRPSEGVEDWKNHMVARGLADGTIKLYTRTIEMFLEQHPMPTARDVRNYSVMRLQKVTPTKVRNDQKALRSFFNFLEAEGLWINNPTRGMQLLKVKRIIRQAPEKEHVDQLLRALDGRERRLKLRLFMLLFLDTGVRISEACTLRLKHINFDRLEVKVMGKGGKERMVPISPVTADLIREYMQNNPKVREHGYLFPYNGRNGYHSKHTLEKSFRHLCDKLGIPRITPHMLRHYFATYALRNGAKLELDKSERPKIDPNFEEVTEGEEIEQKEKLKTKWAQLEAIVGTDKRLKQIAADIVNHFKERLYVMDGKAMIVCMSRRVCVDLYKYVVALQPQWHNEDDGRGFLKVVMTGSASDPLDWQQHIRNKIRREELAKLFKDPKASFKMVIVRDMWLTGFDAPCLHTMYIDKPMRSHGLMQTIARVNRVFKDKPGGLIVDYLGLAPELKQALAVYTESGGTGNTAIDQNEAISMMLGKYEVCCALFHGFNWSKWISASPQECLSVLPAAQEHILKQEDGKTRLIQAVTELSKAFALAVPHERAIAIRDDVAFFQAVKSVLSKSPQGEGKTLEELDLAVRQIVSRAVSAGEVIDIFGAAGLKKPDISVLSEEFLAEVRGMPQKNLAIDLLQRLLQGEIGVRRRKNITQARSFTEMLENAIRKYQNRTIEATQVIEELIALAKEMREASARGEKLGLNEKELAFYDALETNDSAVKVLGDETLRTIARELVIAIHDNVTIDWTIRENVRAHLRVLVKRILRKYGYPPDKQEKATFTVLEQAEVLSQEWAITQR